MPRWRIVAQYPHACAIERASAGGPFRQLEGQRSLGKDMEGRNARLRDAEVGAQAHRPHHHGGRDVGAVAALVIEARETMRRIKQRLSRIFRWSIAQGYRTDDPGGIALDAVLPRIGGKTQHHKGCRMARYRPRSGSFRTAEIRAVRIFMRRASGPAWIAPASQVEANPCNQRQRVPRCLAETVAWQTGIAPMKRDGPGKESPLTALAYRVGSSALTLWLLEYVWACPRTACSRRHSHREEPPKTPPWISAYVRIERCSQAMRWRQQGLNSRTVAGR